MSSLSPGKMLQSWHEQGCRTAWAWSAQFNATPSNGIVHQQGLHQHGRCENITTRASAAFVANALNPSIVHFGFVVAEPRYGWFELIIFIVDDVAVPSNSTVADRDYRRIRLRNSRPIAIHEHSLDESPCNEHPTDDRRSITVAGAFVDRSIHIGSRSIFAALQFQSVALRIPDHRRWQQLHRKEFAHPQRSESIPKYFVQIGSNGHR